MEYSYRCSLAFGLLFTYFDVAKVTDGAVLEVKPKANVVNGGFVSVSWRGIKNPTKDDWLGFYCPKNDSDTHKIHKLNPSNWSAGHGTWKLDVYNMRSECEFRYFGVQNGTARMAVRSQPLTFENGDKAPLQGHIALTGNPTEMRVMWTSSKVNSPLVQFGLSSKDLSRNVTGKSATYLASAMCNPPANSTGYWPVGMIHDVLLTGLKPNTRYYYRYGSSKVMGKIYEFTTALPPGDKTPYKFAVFGDSGYTDQTRKTSSQMVEQKQKNDIRYIMHYGDLSYANGIGHLWEKWFHIWEPAAVRIPFMVAVGNHEVGYRSGSSNDPSGDGKPFWPFGSTGGFVDGSGGECGVSVYYRFHMPDTGNSVFWYSFEYGLVHQIVISTDNDYRKGTNQYKWIEKDLKGVNRTKTPWVIIAGHRAMYHSSSKADEQAAADLQRKHLEPLMHTYQVNLAFWGHNHNYERSCKVLGKVCRSDGITHIVVGTGGKSLHKRWKVQSYSRFRNTTYGHAIVSVKNKTALLVEFFRSEDMKVIDHVWIKKQEEIPSPKGSSSVLTVSLIIYVAMTVALCWQIRFKP